MTYPIIELSADVPEQLEQLGTKTKFWYHDSNGRRMLFKEGRPDTGENWAEKVCCELCRKLDLPHAEYELAKWKGSRKGVVSPTFVPKGGRLVLGNELLAKVVDDYDNTHQFHVRQHTVRIVMAVTSSGNIGLPSGWSQPQAISDAAGVMVGYLMLDALVSNQDRHHENWGLIFLPEQGVYFAPTFDHASSLGRNEPDEKRLERLSTTDKGRDVEAYVKRAKSAFYLTNTSAKPLTTLGTFSEAAKIRPEAARYWLRQLSTVQNEDFMAILTEVPETEISAPARDFACRMMEINAKRLLALNP